MKVGFNMLLWATHVTEERFFLFEALKKTGYDGVEIPVFEGDPEHFRRIGQVLKDEGLKATAVTVMPNAAHDATSSDPEARAGAVRHIGWATDCTEALGGTLLTGPLHQALGRFSGSGRTEEEWANAVETLQTCADHAAKAGIGLSIEPLNRFECYFLNLVEDSARFVDEIARPNVGLLFDTFHSNIEEKDTAEAVRRHIAAINHVHISANDRGTPGKDHLDWPTLFGALKGSGYDGWLTIEAFGRSLPDLAAATRVWRDFFPDPEEVYTFGHKHIRDGWAAA